MTCPTCGQPTTPGKRFCKSCGAALPATCPACGAVNAPDARFCEDCGAAQTLAAPTSPVRAATPPPALVLAEQFNAFQRALPVSLREHLFTEAEGENRVLTILFADLTSSVQRTAHLHPEDAAAVVNDVLKAMVDAILRYEGRINRLLGDAVLAFFGTPVAHENDPERAIRAALDLRAAVRRLGLDVTAGINVGEVYLGAIGGEQHQEVTAQGPVVNLAARLREKAQPGQILVGEAVYRQTRRGFEFARHLVQAKGFAGPVVAYAVLRPLPRPEKLRGIEGMRAILVGRDDELAKLKDALAEVRGGQGQIVTLIGEAGVGKSRLIAELKEVALASAQGQPVPLWLEGRCLDVGMAVSYWPFLDMLRTYFAVASEDDEQARGERIASAVQALVQQGALTPARGREMLPLLGHLLAARFGSDLDERLKGASPEQIKHQTFLAFVDLFVALAKAQPVILVLEDLHWADSLSLDVLSVLMDALRLAPLLLASVYRPEREHKCWHLGTIAARKCPERYTELSLRELTPAQSRRLIESLLHIEALPASVKEQILARAQGNPFFVEEVVRSLIDAGLVYHDGALWRAREDIATVGVPESIQSVILSRVDRLDQEVKHVLQSASVIGRLFRRRLVAYVTQKEAELDQALGELEDRALIYEERAIPEEEYSFQHVLTQETVYQNILRRRRAVFHRQVAEALEALYAGRLEDYYEQLAHHYEQAGMQDKALLYRERAGDKAQAQYANATAEGYYREVVGRLDRLGRAQDAARVREKLGTVLFTMARYDETLETLEQAAQMQRAAGDMDSVARIVAQIAQVYADRGPAEEGVRRIQMLLETLGEDEPSPSVAALYVALSDLYLPLSQNREALAAAERAADLARVVGADRILAQAESRRAAALREMGYEEEALRVAEATIPLAEAVGDLHSLGYTLLQIGFTYWQRGEFEASRQHCERARRVAEKRGDPALVGTALGHLGYLAFLRGDWRQARHDLEQAVALGRERGATWVFPVLVAVLGLLCQAEGEWDEAARYLEESLTLADSGNAGHRLLAQSVLAERDLLEGRPEVAHERLAPLLDSVNREGPIPTFALTVLAWAYLDLGKVGPARDVLADVISRARRENVRLGLVDALRVQALVLLRQGQWSEATAALEEGLTLARSMSYPYAEARLLYVYGQMYTMKGEPETARERLEAALAIFQRLGARKDVEWVEQALADLQAFPT